jgi:hypothetical protein
MCLWKNRLPIVYFLHLVRIHLADSARILTVYLCVNSCEGYNSISMKFCNLKHFLSFPKPSGISEQNLLGRPVNIRCSNVLKCVCFICMNLGLN